MKIGQFVLKFSDEGYSDEIVYLPVCSACDEVITDFDRANIVADYGPLSDNQWETVPAGTLEGVMLLRQPLESLECFHVQCDASTRDRTRFTGWSRVSDVFKVDQRSEIVKRMQRDFRNN